MSASFEAAARGPTFPCEGPDVQTHFHAANPILEALAGGRRLERSRMTEQVRQPTGQTPPCVSQWYGVRRLSYRGNRRGPEHVGWLGPPLTAAGVVVLASCEKEATVARAPNRPQLPGWCPPASTTPPVSAKSQDDQAAQPAARATSLITAWSGTSAASWWSRAERGREVKLRELERRSAATGVPRRPLAPVRSARA